MSHWEGKGKSDEWYTPKYVFDAMECVFDLDAAAPSSGPRYVPCDAFYSDNSLAKEWRGFVWMNPPFGGRNGLIPWLDKFFEHGNGIALVPDRTSAPWWQKAAKQAELIFFVDGKIRFEKPDGTTGDSPSNGTTLFGVGNLANNALLRAQENGLGILTKRTKFLF